MSEHQAGYEIDRLESRVAELEGHILDCQEMHDAGVNDEKIVARILTVYIGQALLRRHVATASVSGDEWSNHAKTSTTLQERRPVCESVDPTSGGPPEAVNHVPARGPEETGTSSRLKPLSDEAWAKMTAGVPEGALTDDERAAVARTKARIEAGHTFPTTQEMQAMRQRTSDGRNRVQVGDQVRVFQGLSEGETGTVIAVGPISESGVRMWGVELDGHRARSIREDFFVVTRPVACPNEPVKEWRDQNGIKRPFSSEEPWKPPQCGVISETAKGTVTCTLPRNHEDHSFSHRPNEATTDPVAAERERCARHCEVLAHFMETGAGPIASPGARLRQAAQSIREGNDASLWDPSYEEDKDFWLPTPTCGHGAQALSFVCDECGALPDGVTIENPVAGEAVPRPGQPATDEDVEAALRINGPITNDGIRAMRAWLSARDAHRSDYPWPTSDEGSAHSRLTAIVDENLGHRPTASIEALISALEKELPVLKDRADAAIDSCPRCTWPNVTHPVTETRDGQLVHVVHHVTCPVHEESRSELPACLVCGEKAAKHYGITVSMTPPRCGDCLWKAHLELRAQRSETARTADCPVDVPCHHDLAEQWNAAIEAAAKAAEECHYGEGRRDAADRIRKLATVTGSGDPNG